MIGERLTKPEALQLCLLELNATLAALIDDLIENRDIKIPVTEIRRPAAASWIRSWAGSYCEASDLGLRVVGPTPAPTAQARLRRLVTEVSGSDLAFVVRNQQGTDLDQRLEALIQENAPTRCYKEWSFSPGET